MDPGVEKRWKGNEGEKGGEKSLVVLLGVPGWKKERFPCGGVFWKRRSSGG